MANGRRRSLCGILVSLIVGAACAGEIPCAPPETLGFSADRLDYIDSFYAEKVKRGELAGIVVLIARHGKVAHFSAVGFADVETKRKLTKDSIFRLYSMTKPIASVALMMLYEEGRFQMNDPLAKFIPDFANLRVLRAVDAALDDTVPLQRLPTIQDALRHTAGFTTGIEKNTVDAEFRKSDLFGLDVSLAEMMSRLSRIPLIQQPGTRFVYSVGPDVQARLVEILSGMPFDEFLERRLFKPLGMKDTGFMVPASKMDRLAAVHWFKNDKLVPLDDAHGHPEGPGSSSGWKTVNSLGTEHKHKGGSSGLVSTAEDYLRFAQMMLNGGTLDGTRVLSPEVVRYMTRDHMGTIGMQTADGKPRGIGFGLGFAVVQDPATAGDMSSEGTFYWLGAAETQFWVDPKEDMVVVAMTQRLGASAFGAIRRDMLGPQIRTLVYSALLE